MQEHESQASGTSTTKFDRILSEIRTKGDLPAAAEVIHQIQNAIRREDCNALDVVRIILKDAALSSKVLRVVNSSFYHRMGSPVTTVTAAIVLLGFQTIRDLSTGLLLIDHFSRSRASRHISEGLRRSLYCGILSQTLSGQIGYSAPEEAYLLGLVANFSHLWIAAYYPNDFEKAVQLQQAEHIPLDRALERVIGGAPADIASAALGHWNFPAAYLDYFRNPPATSQKSIITRSARLAAVVNLSADYVARTTDEGPEGGRQVLHRFENLFSITPDVFIEAARAANTEFSEHASLHGLPPSPLLDTRLLEELSVSEDDTADQSNQIERPVDAEAAPAHEGTREGSGDNGGPTGPPASRNGTDENTVGPADQPQVSGHCAPAPPELGSEAAREPAVASPTPSDIQASIHAAAVDSAPFPSPGSKTATTLGIIADITRSILDRDSISETLSMVLEGIGRIGPFDVVLLALLNTAADRVVGRLGYGEGVQEQLGCLSVVLGEDAGLLSETVLRRMPQMASNSSAAVLVPRHALIPLIPGSSFVSHPVIVRGKMLGALVAGRTNGPVTEADLSVLRLFCDQACLALEKSAH